MSKDLENIPKADMLMGSMRSMGYSFESAVADVIDNSISANCSVVKVLFPTNPLQKSCVGILDDGEGMDDEVLFEAMRYGSSANEEVRSETDLGRFGLGMKSASLSQCKVLTVVSIKNSQLSAYTWDYNYIRDRKEWVVKKHNNDEIKRFPYIEQLLDLSNGTLVLWRDFDVLSKSSDGQVYETLNNLKDVVAQYIALIYHRYLSLPANSRITMYVNNQKIKAQDPFLESNHKTTTKKERTIAINDSFGIERQIRIKPINKGEAGIVEWLSSINRSFERWHVYMSDKLSDKEYAEGKALDMLQIDESQIHVESALHLSVSMRSFRAEKVSLFVHQLLNLQKEEASSTLRELTNYPIVLTRSLDKAKQWLKSHARGSERYGLLASSKAERLKAISINVRYQPDFVHWFLEEDTDIRSSNALEDTLTEFKVQGLEIDWACVAWDADLRLNDDHTKWQHYQLRSGTKWQNINKPINREYQINAYRVLLTRARQGMVLVVPNGDYGVPPDETRKPEWYDGIYNYLKDIGIKEI